MASMYYDSDAEIELIRQRRVAVIGFGSQGHAHALNLRDSGVNVCVGLPDASLSVDQARQQGLRVGRIAEAAEWADLMMVLVPDTRHPAVYNEIRAHLTAGKMLMFAHGFNIRFGSIVPPTDVDVTMVAPKAPGHRLRELFREGEGTPGLIAVHQDATGQAKATTLAYARAIGCTRALVDAGYQPEIAYFECLHELKLIVDLMYRGGLGYMRHSVSDTAEHGDYTGGPRIITHETRATMRQMLREIQSGAYAQAWIAENEKGLPSFTAARERERHHQIEEVGARLRAMMPFLDPVQPPLPLGV